MMENNYLDICAQNVPQKNENVSDHETNLWQSIQANNNVNINIRNSKEMKNTITPSTEELYTEKGTAGRPAAYFAFVVLIMAEFFLE